MFLNILENPFTWTVSHCVYIGICWQRDVFDGKSKEVDMRTLTIFYIANLAVADLLHCSIFDTVHGLIYMLLNGHYG